MSAPYGLMSTSFPVDQKRVDVSRIPKGKHSSVEAQIALSIMSELADELRARGYVVGLARELRSLGDEVDSFGVVKNLAMATFQCKSPRLIVDLFLTAEPLLDGIVDCKLGPLGWRRTWKVPPYEEIWREWVPMRTVINEYLTRTLHLEPLKWEPARAHRTPTV